MRIIRSVLSFSGFCLILFLLLINISSHEVNGQCDTPRPPGLNCTPGYDTPPQDIFDPPGGCRSIASTPVTLTIKTSKWTVHWPDGRITTFSAVAGGQCLYTQNGCCLGSKFEYCWPSHFCPQVGPGFISQFVISAGVRHHTDDCGRVFCRAYEVFDSCDEGGGDTRIQRHTCSEGIGGGCGACDIETCVTTGEHFAQECPSPIIIDIQGNNFNLTDAPNGVDFDIDGNATLEHLAWTSPASDDSWLALDRNGNGILDDGTELFGNFTPQPESGSRDGFIALAEFDKPQNGGNSDGRLDNRDSIFSSLRLWQDANHNGLSESAELFSLPALGVSAIDLDYKEKKRRDEQENWFRYRAKVYDARGNQVGRWAWDVFLTRLR